MAIAKIGPTGYGSWGILWEDFPPMEERGGYSGPMETLEEACRKAKLIVDTYGWHPKPGNSESLTVEIIETVNP